MLNENAKAWVAALRSGEYEQGTGVLRAGNKYCCLGIACVLAVKAGVIPEGVVTGVRDGIYEYGEPEDVQTSGLPQAVREWLRIPHVLAHYFNPELGGYTDLAEKNDNGKTFLEIADIIESEPEGLFMPEEPAAGAVQEYSKLTKEELGQ